MCAKVILYLIITLIWYLYKVTRLVRMNKTGLIFILNVSTPFIALSNSTRIYLLSLEDSIRNKWFSHEIWFLLFRGQPKKTDDKQYLHSPKALTGHE